MIRMGIIGAGKMARRHVEALAKLGRRARLVCYAREHEGEPFTEAQALGACAASADALMASDRVDAVIVCSPNALHRRHAQAALLHGKHVFCEKPLALTLEDADATIAAARASQHVLMVGHVTRHTPIYIAAAEWILSGRLGAPLAAHAARLHSGAGRAWRMDPAIGGGVVFDLSIHDLDILNWLFGAPCDVVARGRKNPSGAYEHIAALLTYPSGVIASLEGSFLMKEPSHLRAIFRVQCEGGRLEIDTANAKAPLRIAEAGEEERAIAIRQAKHAGVASELTKFLDAIEGTASAPPAPGSHLRLEDASLRFEDASLRLEDARIAVACATAIIQAAERCACAPPASPAGETR